MRSEEIYNKLYQMAEELREIVKETGCRISIAADVYGDDRNYGEGRVHSTIFAGDYRIDHFNDGRERLAYQGRDITQKEFFLGEK